MEIKVVVKGIFLYLTSVLLTLFIFNLLLGYGGSTAMLVSLFRPSFFNFFPVVIYFLLLVTIFTSNFELAKKRKWMWFVVLTPLIYRVLLFISLIAMGGDNSWGLLGVMIYGIVEVLAVLIMRFFMSKLLDFENKKQDIIISITFVVLVVLNTLQWFGILRPGLIE